MSARWCDFGSVNVCWRVYVWWSQTSRVAGSRCGGIFFGVSGMGYHVMWTWMRQQTTNDEGDGRVSKNAMKVSLGEVGVSEDLMILEASENMNCLKYCGSLTPQPLLRQRTG